MFEKTKQNVIIIEYTDPQLKEFGKDNSGPIGSMDNYIELLHPIYIYNGLADGAGEHALMTERSFASSYGDGFYVALETEDSKQKWDTVKEKLIEFDLLDYYHEPTTLAQLHQKDAIQFLYFALATLAVSALSIFGMFLLIQTSLQEYFRIHRKRLVLAKLFGHTFQARYGITLISMLTIFAIAWALGASIQSEWSLLNWMLFIFLFSTLYLSMRHRINKLEHEAMNIIIKA